MLRAVRRGEDVADIMIAVDFVEAAEGSRAPHIDDGVAGTREQVGAVGRERKRHDTPLMRLDLLDLVKGRQRPDDDLAILRSSIDGVVLRADGESEDAAAVLEAVKQLWLRLWAVGRFEARQNRHGCRIGHERRHRGYNRWIRNPSQGDVGVLTLGVESAMLVGHATVCAKS